MLFSRASRPESNLSISPQHMRGRHFVIQPCSSIVAVRFRRAGTVLAVVLSVLFLAAVPVSAQEAGLDDLRPELDAFLPAATGQASPDLEGNEATDLPSGVGAPADEFVLDLDVAHLPLDELMARFKKIEAATMPFDIQSRETLRMAEGISDEVRKRYPWGDGRQHERLIDYGMLAKRRWIWKESVVIDHAVRSTERQVSTPEGIYAETQPGVSATPFQPHGDSTLASVSARPLYGVFPLKMTWPSSGVLLSEYYRENPSRIQLNWDDRFAVLDFEFGANEEFRNRFRLWLSPFLQWHPVRMQRFKNVDDNQFFEEWEATEFHDTTAVPHVRRGVLRYRDSGFVPTSPTARARHLGENSPVREKDRPIAYVIEFVVEQSAYGESVDRRRFEVGLLDPLPEVGLGSALSDFDDRLPGLGLLDEPSGSPFPDDTLPGSDAALDELSELDLSVANGAAGVDVGEAGFGGGDDLGGGLDDGGFGDRGFGGGPLGLPRSAIPGQNYVAGRNVIVAISDDQKLAFAYCDRHPRWVPQDLEPVAGVRPVPVVGGETVAVQHGRHCYAYSSLLGGWDKLSLPKRESAVPVVSTDSVSVHSKSQGDFVFKTAWGKWFSADEIKAGRVAEYLQTQSETTPESESAEQQITVLPLENALAGDAARIIEQFLGHNGQDVTLAIDERTNTILIRGDEKLVKEVSDLLDVLDVPVPDRVSGPVPSRGGSGWSSADTQMQNAETHPEPSGSNSVLRNSWPRRNEPAPIPNQRTKARQPAGAGANSAGAQPAPQAFDLESSDRQTFSLMFGVASDQSTDSLRRQFAELEEQAQKLASKLREQTSRSRNTSREDLKQSLREAVHQAFKARQKLQQAELAEFSQRVKRIQQSIATRDRIAEKIIDRRVEELLDPNLNWEQPAPPGPARATQPPLGPLTPTRNTPTSSFSPAHPFPAVQVTPATPAAPATGIVSEPDPGVGVTVLGPPDSAGWVEVSFQPSPHSSLERLKKGQRISVSQTLRPLKSGFDHTPVILTDSELVSFWQDRLRSPSSQPVVLRVPERKVIDLIDAEKRGALEVHARAGHRDLPLSHDPAAARDPELNGDWQLQSITGKGILGHEQGLVAEIQDGTWTMIRGDQKSPYRLVVDRTRTPRTISLLPDKTVGRQPPSSHGIYKIADDQLVIAWAAPDSPHEIPEDFTGQIGSIHTWKRLRETSFAEPDGRGNENGSPNSEKRDQVTSQSSERSDTGSREATRAVEINPPAQDKASQSPADAPDQDGPARRGALAHDNVDLGGSEPSDDGGAGQIGVEDSNSAK